MNEVSRLRWHCRRGMKELDVLLERYLERRYPTAPEAERAAFRRLLEFQDPALWACLSGREEPADRDLSDVVRRIRSPD